PKGGQQFNVYNIDPYVWFVHTVLGLSGYGFSVDDDTADVGAPGLDGAPAGSPPTNLQIVFSELGNLKNQLEWFPSVNWGTVEVTGVKLSPTTFGGKPATLATFANTPENQKKYWQISNPSPTVPGAFVQGEAGTIIPPGTNVLAQGATTRLELI